MTQYAELPSHIQKRVAEKKQKLASMGQLTPQRIKEISERMQVDFVYNSNKIEGSTLSRGETELVLRGITIGKKSIPDELRPIELAAQIHYDFSWIHPCEDGNGRMSRLLLNLILVRNGYPFVVIKNVDKPQYLRALREMDVSGNFKPFLIYISRCVEQTLDLYLMSKKPAKKEEEFLPLAKLAKNTPYSAEYLSLLARKGRIDAIKEGKTWKSTKKIINTYVKEQKGK